MAKHEATYNHLEALNTDINRLQQQSPAFYFFFFERVLRFRQQNQMHLSILLSRTEELIKKYVMHDEDAQPLTEVNDQGVKVYKFETPEIKEEYLEKQSKFLSGRITIHV